MADFYIRNMDIETKNKLKQEARKKKVSLNTLVKSILYNHTLSPEIKNMDAANSAAVTFCDALALPCRCLGRVVAPGCERRKAI